MANLNSMEFSPFNPIIKSCLQSMALRESGKADEAKSLLMDAWQQASTDYEKFMVAHFVSQLQESENEKLKWLETALEFALKVNDHAASSALPSLYSRMSACHQALSNSDKTKTFLEKAEFSKNHPSDQGPFYHGTRADLKKGDLLLAGLKSNYKSELQMNHIYFTAMVNGAGLAAALAKGEGSERVYIVEPTGLFENDPNVTDKKFPGNPTRSYRSEAPLKIVGEVKEWERPKPEELENFRKKLKDNEGEIIN
jgi:rifampin ADP-ribosylating transferase